ncbi:MAG: LysR substrate-binding domain-containing protein [Sciscionella sp.]
MELSLHRLRILRELDRRGTLTAAAAALHYTTSAISQQLAALERDVNATLFERFGRKVRLTDLGRLLADHAEEILGAEERAVIALEQAQQTISARLTLGVFATVATGLLPRALTDVAEHYPGITLLTREADPEEAAAAVRQGDFDLAFVIDYPDVPMPWEASLERVTIGREEVNAVIAKGRAGRGEPIALADLADDPWILAGPESHFGHAVRVACQREGFEPDVRHEVDEQATAMAMVAAGLGVTLVPDLGLAFRWSDAEVVQLRDPITRDIAIAYRTSAEHRPALRIVIQAVRAAAAHAGLR